MSRAMPRRQGSTRKVRRDPTPEIQELTAEQIVTMIEVRSSALLGISGDEFLHRYRSGTLAYSSAEASVIVLADLLDYNGE